MPYAEGREETASRFLKYAYVYAPLLPFKLYRIYLNFIQEKNHKFDCGFFQSNELNQCLLCLFIKNMRFF